MLLEGHQLGRYRLVRQVGSGGMGTIFLAEDTHMPRQVAVKVVHTEDEMQHSQEAAQRMLRSFRREMRAIVQLDHPHILPVFDFGQETINKATYAYLVMLYRPEGSLSDWLCQPQNAARLTLSDVAQLLTQAAQALQHAHARGIVHQDVKPSNFLVRVDNELLEALPELLLADFGIAQFFSATTTQSQSHNVRGTPMFMAPEQWDGRPVPASDQYALAIMAFRLLAGRFPFQGTMGQIMHHHYMMQPPTPSSLNPQLNTAIDHTILRALAKQPDQRYPNMLAFASAFTQALRTPEDLLQVPLTFSAPGDASLPSISEQISGASMPFQPAKQETGKTPSLPMPPLNEPSATQDQMPQRVHLTKNAVPSRIGTSALINDLSSDATPTPPNPHAGVNIPAASDDSTFISPPRQMGSTVLIPCAAAISIDDTRPPSLNNSTETQQPTLVPQPVPVPPTIQLGPTGKASLSHNWLQPIISHTQRFSTRQKSLLIGLLALVILASSGILLYKDLSGSNGNSAHTQNSAQASTIIQQGQTPASSVTIVAKHTVTPTASQTPPRTQTSTPVVGSTAASGTTSQPTTTPTSSSSTTRQPTATPTPTPTAVPKPAATPTPTPGCTISSWSLTLKTESSGSTVFHVTAYCNRTVYIELQAPTYETNIQICFGSSNCTGWNSAPSTAAGTWVEFDSGVSVGAGFTINAECHSSCSSTYTVSGKAKY